MAAVKEIGPAGCFLFVFLFCFAFLKEIIQNVRSQSVIKSLPKVYNLTDFSNFFSFSLYLLFRNCIAMFFKNSLISGCMLRD